MINHADVDAVTFTGSTGVAGASPPPPLPRRAGPGGDGRQNAAVVLDDADFDLAVEQVMLGAFRSTGQKCTAHPDWCSPTGSPTASWRPWRSGPTPGGRRPDRRGDRDGSGRQRVGPAEHHRRHRDCHSSGRLRPRGRRRLQRQARCRRAISSRRPSSNSTARPTFGNRTVRAGPGGAAGRGARRKPSRSPTTASSGCPPPQWCSPRTSPACCKPSSMWMSVCCTSIPNPPGPTRTFRSAAPEKSRLGPGTGRAAAREFFTHTTTVYLRGGTRAYEPGASTASSSSASAGCWPARTPP